MDPIALQRIFIGAKPAIRPYNLRRHALKASYETFARVLAISRGISAAGRATTAL